MVPLLLFRYSRPLITSIRQKIPIKPRRQAPNRSINNCSLTPANAGDPSYARNSFNLISNSVPSDMGGPNPASSGILGDVERARSNGSGNNTWADPRRACQRAPPPGYICYRCGRKGHFISDCPTIGDKDFDKPRLKRTTGIPKIFLKTVENTQSSRSGVMIAQTGELVIAQPNDFEWQKLYTKTKNSLGPGNIYELVEKDSPSEYRCGICERLCRDPVSTSCCDTNFCYECINARLLDSEDREERLRCPRCSRNQAPEDLVPRNDIQTAIESLLRDFVLKQNNGEKVQAENDSAPGTDATSRSAMKPPINGTRCVEEGAEMEVCANPNDADSSNPAPRTATGNFHHYAVPRRKRVSKPFTFISLSQVSNAEGAQDTVEVSQPATDTNGEHAGYISKSTTQMRSGFSSNPHFRNRSKLSTKPFTVISPESGSSVKKDKGSTNIATNGRLGPDFAGDKPSAAIISWGPNRQTTGAISRKRRNYSKTAGEDTISRAVSSNVSGRERNQIQVHPNSVSSVTARSSSTDLTEDPLTDEPADRSDTPQTVSNVYSPPGEYHRAGSKRGKLLGGEFNEAESGSNDTRLPPGDEDNTGPLEGENQPINQSASTSQDTEGKILVKLSGSQPLPGAPPTLLQEPIHLYKPGRNRVVSQRGDLPPNMPQSALISTIPLSSREFPSSSYSPRPAAPSFFTASDVGPQGVRSFDPIHLQSSPYDMFIPGPPLVNNVPLDSGPRPAGAPQARYRFAPNANVR